MSTLPCLYTSVMDSEMAPIENKNKWKSIVRELIIFAIIAGGIVWPFRVYVAEPYLVDGRSMDPTFKTGDYLIVDKISGTAENPRRNSVVVFNATNAGQPHTNFIKRIIGLPGETVVMKDGVITIINSENPEGFVIDQSYVTHTCANTQAPNCIDGFQKTLAGNEYFVMGDNRAESHDSRYWGPLKKQYIVGRPVVRLFGIHKVGWLPLPVLSKFGMLPGEDDR